MSFFCSHTFQPTNLTCQTFIVNGKDYSTYNNNIYCCLVLNSVGHNDKIVFVQKEKSLQSVKFKTRLFSDLECQNLCSMREVGAIYSSQYSRLLSILPDIEAFEVLQRYNTSLFKIVSVGFNIRQKYGKCQINKFVECCMYDFVLSSGWISCQKGNSQNWFS